MKEVVRALESGIKMPLRCRKILSRMLDHQRSMQEKDFEEKENLLVVQHQAEKHRKI